MDPFVIIHHHRKAKKLKKMREIRRRKILNKKEFEKLAIDAQRKEAQEHINRSMLLEEQDWNNVKSLILSEESKVSLDESVAFEQKLKTLCWEVLYLIPSLPKTLIYLNSFSSFDYEC
jgi:DNA-directed RNA polymerase specialized sigma subunit